MNKPIVKRLPEQDDDKREQDDDRRLFLSSCLHGILFQGLLQQYHLYVAPFEKADTLREWMALSQWEGKKGEAAFRQMIKPSE